MARTNKTLRDERLADGVCTSCGLRPPTDGKKGPGRWCDECKEKAKERDRRRSKEQVEKRSNALSEKRKERLSQGLCVYCGSPSNGKRWCDECRESHNKTRRVNQADSIYYENRKRRAMALYDSKCNNCGISDPRVLCFHHIEHNGRIDRIERYGVRNAGGTGSLHAELLRDGKRDDIELLCANCHLLVHWWEGRRGYRPSPESMRNPDFSERYDGGINGESI